MRRNEMDKTFITIEIGKMIKKELGIGELAGESLLFGVAGGFDSLTLLNFILELENKFDVIIPDDDLVPDNFSTVDRIAEYIETLVKSNE